MARVLGGIVTWMGANPDGPLYSTAFFLGGGGWGACELRRCTCEYMGEGKIMEYV